MKTIRSEPPIGGSVDCEAHPVLAWFIGNLRLPEEYVFQLPQRPSGSQFCFQQGGDVNTECIGFEAVNGSLLRVIYFWRSFDKPVNMVLTFQLASFFCFFDLYCA